MSIRTRSKHPITISRIRNESAKFTLSDIPLSKFVVLGRQHRDTSVIHTAYLRKPSLGTNCYIHPRIKISGYCSYSLVSCERIGLLGVVFFTYCKKTQISNNIIIVERNVQLEKHQEELFQPLFTLERLDLLVYPSDCGSVIIIPTILADTSLLVQVS